MAIDDLGKLRSDVNFLSGASPQQMGTVSRLLQQGQQADPYESLAFLIANNMQRDMRQPNPQAPQQTILQKRLAELQSQANPMMGGVPNVGPNQMALQQSAMQNPNTAGIAAAPENMPAPPMPNPAPQAGIPGAATGGLVAFAHGGEVRGFEDGGFTWDKAKQALSDFGQSGLGYIKNASDWYTKTLHGDEQESPKKDAVPTHEKTTPGSSKVPKHRSIDEVVEGADTGMPGLLYPDAALAGEKLPPHAIAYDQGLGGIDGARTAGYDRGAPRDDGAKIDANENVSYDKQVQALADLMGHPYAASAELKSQLEKEKASANKEKWMMAAAQGLGALFSAPTPYFSQALGHALTSGAAAYGAGGDREAAIENKLLGLQEEAERLPVEQRQKALNMWWNQKMAQSAQNAAERRGLLERAVSGQYGLMGRGLGSQNQFTYEDALKAAQREMANDINYFNASDEEKQKMLRDKVQQFLVGAQQYGASTDVNPLAPAANIRSYNPQTGRVE